jgi:hypothetical protein
VTRYRTIVADPPWDVMGGSLRGGVGEGFKSSTVPSGPGRCPTRRCPSSRSRAAAGPADDDCALYLWTINAYVEDAYDIVRAWGFKPSTLLTWAKNPMGGGLGGAWGISTEFFLYARRGRPSSGAHGTWFNWKRHYVNGKPSHSAKPDAFYDLVEQHNDGPYVEMFARRARLGWDYWGDERDAIELCRRGARRSGCGGRPPTWNGHRRPACVP